jgi:hypothetical protein
MPSNEKTLYKHCMSTKGGGLLARNVQCRSSLTHPEGRDQHNGQAYALEQPVAFAFVLVLLRVEGSLLPTRLHSPRM